MTELVDPANAKPVPPRGAHSASDRSRQTASTPQPPEGATGGQPPVGDTAPLVLGILSIVFFGIVGLVLSIVGLVKSNKALDSLPDSGKAKGGRICSIVGLVLSSIKIVAVIVLVILGVNIFGIVLGEEAAVRQSASATIEEALYPSANQTDSAAAYFDAAFEAATSVSFTQLGISSEQFATWLSDGATYEIVDVEIEDAGGANYAVVDVEVTSHSVTDMEKNITTLSNSLDASAFAGIASEADLYRIVGSIVREAMDETPLSTKDVELVLVKIGDTWQTTEQDAFDFAIEAFL